MLRNGKVSIATSIIASALIGGVENVWCGILICVGLLMMMGKMGRKDLGVISG